MLFLLVLCPFIRLVLGQAPHPDLINNLPGQPDPRDSQINQYSGFLEIGAGKHLHYWFVEVANNVFEDHPLVLWLTGGPGCSSLDALLSETGPYSVVASDLTLEKNPYSWSQFAHVLYVESPVGVGFSFADQPEDYNDTQIVDDLVKGLKIFFSNHSTHRNDFLYIFTEGYASIQGVLLAERMFAEPSMHLDGLLIEGGFLDEKNNVNSLIDYAYYHGLISSSLWNSLQENCCNNGSCSYYKPKKESQCQDNVNNVNDFIGELNTYNVFTPCKLPPHFQLGAEDLGMSHLHCINQTAETLYLNKDNVKSALHVADSRIPRWAPCSENISSHYKPSSRSILQGIHDLTKMIPVVLFTGDADMEFNYLGIQQSINSLKLNVSGAWHPWQYQDSIAGFVTNYVENLSVFTIKGAGHFVARSHAGPLYHLMDMFVHGNL